MSQEPVAIPDLLRQLEQATKIIMPDAPHERQEDSPELLSRYLEHEYGDNAKAKLALTLRIIAALEDRVRDAYAALIQLEEQGRIASDFIRTVFEAVGARGEDRAVSDGDAMTIRGWADQIAALRTRG